MLGHSFNSKKLSAISYQLSAKLSRIGKKSIKIPEGVDIKIDGQKIYAKGSKGELEKILPNVLTVRVEDGAVIIGLKRGINVSKENSKFWGLGRALAATMIKGVSDGFEKVLEFNGVGFKAQVHQLTEGDSIELNLGFTNPVSVKAPEGVTFRVEKNIIKVAGSDKEKVGHAAALIRAAKPPEPYKGSGIKYKDEVIIRKAGKKAVATAG